MPDGGLPQRRTPAKGVHISLAGRNWVFLTVNAKDRVLFPPPGRDALLRVRPAPKTTPSPGRDALPRVRRPASGDDAPSVLRGPNPVGRDDLPVVRSPFPANEDNLPIARGTGWLAQPSIQRALHEIWLHSATAWLVSDYLLMPDHVHLFCAPNDLRFTIERWIAFWKDSLAKARPDAGAFQRGGFHHRLRDSENYAEKWRYMRENPLRAGLVAKLEDWPYQGRVHEIRWS